MPKDRKIGVSLDFSKSSTYALKWAMDNLASKDDTFYIIYINHRSLDDSNQKRWGTSGSPLIPLSQFREPKILKNYDVPIDMEVLDLLDTGSRQKEIHVVAKIYWASDAREKLLDAVDDLKLDCVVMGSRGLGTLQRILLGSVSNFMVDHASCPITIVKQPSLDTK